MHRDFCSPMYIKKKRKCQRPTTERSPNCLSAGELLDLLLYPLAALLASELLAAVLLALCLPVLGTLGVLVRVLQVGVLANLGMSLLVHLLKTIGCNILSEFVPKNM